MTMVTRTYREIDEFAGRAQRWLQSQGETRTRLSYALRKVLKRLEPILAEYQDQLTDIFTEHALLDDKAALIVKDNQYSYSKDGMRARQAAQRALAAQAASFEPFFVAPDSLPPLGELEILAFEGFVIEEGALDPALDALPVSVATATTNGQAEA